MHFAAMAATIIATGMMSSAAAAPFGSLSREGSILLDPSTQTFQFVEKLVDGAVARGVYTDMADRPTSFFGELTIRTSSLGGKVNDSAQAYAMGMLEGYLTTTRIHQVSLIAFIGLALRE